MTEQASNNIIISVVRTFVPYAVGMLATQGIVLSDTELAGITSILAFIVSLVYYVVVRFIEKKYPKAGWLLGVPAKPTYKGVQ